jgi:hypothetical protein
VRAKEHRVVRRAREQRDCTHREHGADEDQALSQLRAPEGGGQCHAPNQHGRQHAEQQNVREQIEVHQAAHFRGIGLNRIADHVLVHDRAIGAREVRAGRGDHEQRACCNPQSDSRRHEREQQRLQAHDHNEQRNEEQCSTRCRMPHRGNCLVPELEVVQHGPGDRDEQNQGDVGAQCKTCCPTVAQPCVECRAEAGLGGLSEWNSSDV